MMIKTKKIIQTKTKSKKKKKQKQTNKQKQKQKRLDPNWDCRKKSWWDENIYILFIIHKKHDYKSTWFYTGPNLFNPLSIGSRSNLVLILA